MGQYFAAVNTDKKEFVCPWCIGGGAKLWEWAANTQGAIFTLLLRQSTAGGGGDFYYTLPHPRHIDLSNNSPKQAAQAVTAAVALGVAAEGVPIQAETDSVVGRWAGGPVALVGDYDQSNVWDELYKNRTYKNISKELVDAWNAFIDIDNMKLTFSPCHSCSRQQ